MDKDVKKCCLFSVYWKYAGTVLYLAGDAYIFFIKRCYAFSQRLFPKGNFPSDNFSSGNIPNVQFPKWQLLKS